MCFWAGFTLSITESKEAVMSMGEIYYDYDPQESMDPDDPRCPEIVDDRPFCRRCGKPIDETSCEWDDGLCNECSYKELGL